MKRWQIALTAVIVSMLLLFTVGFVMCTFIY